MADFDNLVDDNASAQAPVQDSTSFDSLQDDSEKYGSTGEQVKAGLEGAAQGAVGPLAPLAETKLFGVKPEDIRGRAEANPITHGIGEVAGFGASALSGTGIASVLGKAGEAAAGLTKVGEAVNAAREAAQVAGETEKGIEAAGKAAEAAQTLTARVGSSAVRNAAEMAVLQGSDEVAKQILQDPTASAESAISNVGLAAAIGGTGGAFFTGAVSPLWKATVGDHLDNGLKLITDKLNGAGAVLPDELKAAETELGINVGPEIRAANSSPEMMARYNNAKRMGSAGVQEAEDNLHKQASDAVVNSLGRPIEEFQNFDRGASGRDAMNTYKQEYKSISDPISKEYEEIEKPFQNAVVDPETNIKKLDQNLSDLALRNRWVGQDIPQYKIFESVMDRLPRIKTAADLKDLMKDVGNIAASDYATFGYPARQIKNVIKDTIQDVVGGAIKEESPNLFERYMNVSKRYADLADLTDTMGQELGLGRFEGPASFLKKLESKRSPEQFLSRLSPDKNAELLKILQERFPGTAEHIRVNEMRNIVAPAVRAAKGETSINTKTFQNAINKKMEGQPGLVKWALGDDVINKVKAAETIKGAIPSIKDSGTPGGLLNLLRKAPATALGAVAALTGHNPIFGAILGHGAQILSRDVPDALDLAMLRFVGADKPINAAGFKAMTDFMGATIKGDNMIKKSTENVFKREAQVIPLKFMPTAEATAKIDKLVADNDNNQNKMNDRLINSPNVHYMEDHHAATASSITGITQYLKSIKPAGFKPGPLDREIPPSKQEMARYNRALDIAQQPAIVLQHIKDGTLQVNDIKDISSMYPSLFKKMQNELMTQAANIEHDEGSIPYKTRMSMSLFLSQPLDATMQPMSILAAQPKPAQPPPQQNQGKPKPSAMKEKSTNVYQTPGQQAERDRASRD